RQVASDGDHASVMLQSCESGNLFESLRHAQPGKCETTPSSRRWRGLAPAQHLYRPHSQAREASRLPVRQSTKVGLAIGMKAAKARGLTIPFHCLAAPPRSSNSRHAQRVATKDACNPVLRQRAAL